MNNNFWNSKTLRGINAINVLKVETVYQWFNYMLTRWTDYSSKNAILTTCLIVEQDIAPLLDMSPIIGDVIRIRGESDAAISSLRQVVDDRISYLHERYRALIPIKQKLDVDNGELISVDEMCASLHYVEPDLYDRLQLFRRWSIGTDPEQFRLDQITKDLNQLESFCGVALSDHPEILILDCSETNNEDNTAGEVEDVNTSNFDGDVLQDW